MTESEAWADGPGVWGRVEVVTGAGAREVGRVVWRHLPWHLRRWWRGVERVNLFALRHGARPIASARMRAGHRLLLDLRSGTEWLSFYTGRFDDGRIRAARALMRGAGGGVAVDAGANIGFWTVPLALEARATGGRVLAVEPVASNARRLRQNLLLNGVDDVVLVRQEALSDTAGALTMTLREDFADGAETGNAAVLIDDGTDDRWTQVRVPAGTLDDLLAECRLPRVDLVKADLEGHEDRFLAGAERTFSVDRPVAFVEWNATYHARRGTDMAATTTPLLRRWDHPPATCRWTTLCWRRPSAPSRWQICCPAWPGRTAHTAAGCSRSIARNEGCRRTADGPVRASPAGRVDLGHGLGHHAVPSGVPVHVVGPVVIRAQA
jgi:FkbM family methyltransferase